MLRKGKGFTLIELVLVISLLGLLAIAALPSFINIGTQARQASRDGVVGAVRSGIALYRANNLVTVGPPGRYPGDPQVADSLDRLANTAWPAGTIAGPNNPFFQTVLNQGVSDSNWRKGINDLTYIYNDGTNTFTYTYSSATGTFTSPTAP